MIETQKIVNNNTRSPPNASYSTSQCCRLAPCKKTFLKSNQLITKYVQQGNVEENSCTINAKSVPSVDAYEMCKEELEIHEEKERDKEEKHVRILDQAKANSHQVQVERIRKEKEIDSQAKKIGLMVDTMYVKCADIMHGRNNSNYTRKSYEAGEVQLKDLKNTTYEKSLRKVEATRKVMINKSHKLAQEAPFSSQKSLTISILSDSFLGNSLNNSSILSNSLITSQKKSRSKKAKNHDLYKKHLRKTSYDNLYNTKRRNAVNEGFAMCWKLGTQDKKLKKVNMFQNQEKLTQRRKKSLKRPAEKVSLLHQICQSQKFQLAVNRKYCDAFQGVVGKFGLVEM